MTGAEVKPKLFKHHRHRAVIRELNLHVGTKDPGGYRLSKEGGKFLDEQVEQWLGDFGLGGTIERRTVSFGEIG
jgi:hypothetical protein